MATLDPKTIHTSVPSGIFPGLCLYSKAGSFLHFPLLIQKADDVKLKILAILT